MYPLLETICIRSGVPQNLSGHEARWRQSVRRLFGCEPGFDLRKVICSVDVPESGVYKCRVLYHASDFSLSCEPYETKTIRSLRCVEANHLVYDLKYADRQKIDHLFMQRGTCDDVLIVQDGWIRDTSYGNICLLADGQWYTPEQPLLPGTMLQLLLDQQLIVPRPIRLSDLGAFSHFRVINAFRSELEADGAVASIVTSL